MFTRAKSFENSLIRINQLPPEVFSLIPDYYHEGERDRTVITMSHVCRRWRNVLLSRSSLWTRLDFVNIDKTQTYIQRLGSSPPRIYLRDPGLEDEQFAPIIPHIPRLKSLAVIGCYPNFMEHFRCRAPLLEKLVIHVCEIYAVVVDDTLFGGDFSSLRKLVLCGVTISFPWKNLGNLQVADLDLSEARKTYRTTEILNFFEAAPLLRKVWLSCSMLDPSDAPPDRIVPLCHLKVSTINVQPLPSIILTHLHIPNGASLTSEIRYSDNPPLSDYLQNRSQNFGNISDVRAINLDFSSLNAQVRLSGPSGSLRVTDASSRRRAHPDLERRTFSSLDPILSTTQRLMISGYGLRRGELSGVEDCPVLRTLFSTENLRTLVLVGCAETAFTRVLDPEQQPSDLVACPNLEEVVLYAEVQRQFDFEQFARMARNRSMRGAKLSRIAFINRDPILDELVGGFREVEEHVGHVDYRVEQVYPAWDKIPSESGYERE